MTEPKISDNHTITYFITQLELESWPVDQVYERICDKLKKAGFDLTTQLYFKEDIGNKRLTYIQSTKQPDYAQS